MEVQVVLLKIQTAIYHLVLKKEVNFLLTFEWVLKRLVHQKN